jgi:hypothetical protein
MTKPDIDGIKIEDQESGGHTVAAQGRLSGAVDKLSSGSPK